MGLEFGSVEVRKIMFLMGLVLASVVVIQYIQTTYTSSLVSLFSTNKDIEIEEHGNYLNSSSKFTHENPSDTPVEEAVEGIGSLSFEKGLERVDNQSSHIRQESVIFGNQSCCLSTSLAVNDVRNISRGVIGSPPPKEMPQKMASIVSLSEMNDMLIHSRVSSFSKKPHWPTAADQELILARFLIENSNDTFDHPTLYGPIYRNLSMFLRSYEIMEQRLKIYVYKEGKKPVFHQPRLKGIYASEGWFMRLVKASRFTSKNPDQAHLFYLPFSSQRLEESVYVPNSHTFHDTIEYLKNYLDTIRGRYSFWNRTNGEDHFLVACHDWAPIETKQDMASCIRALCNADTKEGFQIGKDTSLPETYVQSPVNPSKPRGGKPPSQRSILAFFAGRMHGYVRPILLKHWGNKDPDMKISGIVPKKRYIELMKTSKYCICAKGYEVNSPRVAESIMYGCVPVIVSDDFVPPFFEILKWDSFAVFVAEKDIPNLKSILMSISDARYLIMQHRVKQVKQHFVWHKTPVKYDVFYMILHSIWFNRVLRLPPAP